MFARWEKGDLMVLTGLVAFGLFTILAAVFVTRMISLNVIERDAHGLATQWALQVSADLARPVSAATENSVPHYGIGEIRTFQSGQHFSVVRRFALFRANRSALAKGPDFLADDLIGLASDIRFDKAFQYTITTGESLLRYASSGMPGMPEHTARVFVPIKEAGRVVQVMVVDTDQSSAYLLFSQAFDIVILATSALMVLGISVPVFVVWRRIRRQGSMQRQIHFLAAHDLLTGLANRTQYIQYLAEALEQAGHDGGSVAVLCTDLDRFRDINDALGHPIGDALLVSAAGRIQELIDEEDAVAGRLGGNEFSIMVRGEAAMNRALVLARRLRERLAEPHLVERHRLTVTASLGMAVGPADGDDPTTLLRRAELALDQAKASGDNAGRFFYGAMEKKATRRRQLEQDLRNAIAEDQLRLQYQPQFDLRTARIVGYEALIRWHHPQRGLVSPGAFIPCAERSGLIHAIGEWALRTACRYAASWPEPWNIAVNLSAIQFMNPDLVATIGRILDETGLDPKRLEVEITESLLLQNVDQVQRMLRQLGRLGVAVALDDFGTGYSSLSYLARFPFNKIKIDQSFVHALGSRPEALAVVKTIVGLGGALDITIIAEGVETEAQAEALRAAGCAQVQGYLYGRPADRVLDGWEATVRIARAARRAPDAA